MLLEALALVLILEGLMPLIAPKFWRQLLNSLLAMPDHQLRLMGGSLIAVGSLAILLV